MVKPQFEVGKDRVGKGGVVRDLGAARRGGAARGRRGGPPRLGRPRGHHQPAARTVGQRRVLPVAAARRGDDRCATTSRAEVERSRRGWGCRVRRWTRERAATHRGEPVRRVLLLAHTGRDDAREVARAFCKALTAHGIVVGCSSARPPTSGSTRAPFDPAIETVGRRTAAPPRTASWPS